MINEPIDILVNINPALRKLSNNYPPVSFSELLILLAIKVLTKGKPRTYYSIIARQLDHWKRGRSLTQVSIALVKLASCGLVERSVVPYGRRYCYSLTVQGYNLLSDFNRYLVGE